MKYIYLFAFIIMAYAPISSAEIVFDKARDRHIPIDVIHPQDSKSCSPKTQCRVAFLSAGYGVSHLEYVFITDVLSQQGFLVVAIGHELPSDPPLSVKGNLFETRSENWIRGANTLSFLQENLSARFAEYDFERLLLIGHSNGGDISAWLGNHQARLVDTIITLDHRRVPLPRTNAINILSIRASDFPADDGVLPSTAEQDTYHSCVVTIPKARHNDMTDTGPEWLKTKIQHLLRAFLNAKSCQMLTKI